MNDHTDPLVILAAGDPSIIPPAFVDVLDAIVAVDPSLSSTVDRIIDELTDDHIEIVKTIAALATLRQAVASHQTFSEWIGTEDIRMIPGGHDIAIIMNEDPDWPRGSRTHTELRDYVAEEHPNAILVFERAWDHYRALVLAPYGTTQTIRTDTQYAARVSWSNGTDEIHPRTTDGTSRFEAERHACSYNTDVEIRGRRHDGMTELLMSSASVVRRTVVYGPWYAV